MLLQRAAPWSEMEGLINPAPRHGFLFWSKNNAHPLMQAAGDDAGCLWYLMPDALVHNRHVESDPLAADRLAARRRRDADVARLGEHLGDDVLEIGHPELGQDPTTGESRDTESRSSRHMRTVAVYIFVIEPIWNSESVAGRAAGK